MSGTVHRIVIAGGLDRHALEAAILQIRRLGRRHGFTVSGVRVETVADGPSRARQVRRARKVRRSSSA